MLQQRAGNATPGDIADAAWLKDYRQAMGNLHSGYAYAMRQPLADLRARLEGLARRPLPPQTPTAAWISAARETQLVRLDAPDLNLRPDVRRGHINPRPAPIPVVAGAVRVTWLPTEALRQALRKAGEAIAGGSHGARAWQAMEAGLAQVKVETYLHDASLLRAYGLLQAAAATAPLDNGVTNVLLRRAAAFLQGDAALLKLSAALRGMAAQGHPQAYPIGAQADHLRELIAERARLWFAHARAPVEPNPYP